jgi:hypothetical protein
MESTEEGRTATLLIDEKFMEQFNLMTYNWDYRNGGYREAGRLILHLFSRIQIVQRDLDNGKRGWVLTVVGEESEFIQESVRTLRKQGLR